MPTESTDGLLIISDKKQRNNYQPNHITESRQLFTALEKNIVVTVVNKLTILYFEKSLPLFPNQNIEFLIPYSDLSKSRNYDEIEKAAKSLQVKQQGFAFTNDKGERFFTYMVPFPKVQNVLIKGKMYLKITMFSDVIPYYTQMGKRFTSYDFEIMRSLVNVFSKRMYEILMSHPKKETFEYEVDHLREILNVPPQYRYVDFVRTCLDVACKEIKKKSGIELTFEPSKKDGKKITGLRFFKKTSQLLAQNDVDASLQYINSLPVGEAISNAYRLFNLYTFNEQQRKAIVDDQERLATFFRVHAEIASGQRTDIVNHTAYMVKSLKIEKIKSPARKKSETPASSRTNAPKSIGSILGGLDHLKKNK